MALVVTAPYITAKIIDDAGTARVFEFHRGQALPDNVSPEIRQHLLDGQLVADNPDFPVSPVDGTAQIFGHSPHDTRGLGQLEEAGVIDRSKARAVRDPDAAEKDKTANHPSARK